LGPSKAKIALGRKNGRKFAMRKYRQRDGFA
jgi:hypothetical protein